MYKKIKIGVVLTTVFCCTTLFAQNEHRVGINTDDGPQRTLHINGSLKVEGLQNAANESGNYSKLLVINDAGDIEYIDRWTIVPSIQRIRKMLSFTIGQANNEVLTSGKFQFRFDELGGNDVTRSARIQFRLSEKPANTVHVYTNFEQNWNADGYQFDADPRPIIFTSSDADNNVSLGPNIGGNGNPISAGWSGWRELVNQSGTSNVAPGEINELYISYPAEDLFYRILIYRMVQGGQTSWLIISEEYSN